MESIVSDEVTNEKQNTSSSSKESDGENLEAIRRFIEDQEKEIQELEKDKNGGKQGNTSEIRNKEIMEVIEPGEPMVIATSVINMILSESEAKIASANMKKLPKHQLSHRDKGISYF